MQNVISHQRHLKKILSPEGRCCTCSNTESKFNQKNQSKFFFWMLHIINCSVAWPQFCNNDSGQLLWICQMRVLLHYWVDYISRKDVTKVPICLVLVVWDDIPLLVFSCRWHLPWRVPDLFHFVGHAANHHPLTTRHQAVTQWIWMISVGLITTRQRVPACMLLTAQWRSPLSHWVTVI